MKRLGWWMRAVGLLYLLMFVAAAIVKAPISAEGPPGVLALAAGGDPIARFVVDTWVTFGLYLGAIGVGLLIAARRPEGALALVGFVIVLEGAGMLADVYKLVRGIPWQAPMIWLVIHSAVIATGVVVLRRARA